MTDATKDLTFNPVAETMKVELDSDTGPVSPYPLIPVQALRGLWAGNRSWNFERCLLSQREITPQPQAGSSSRWLQPTIP